jgi:hypothetical protein
MQDTHNEIMRAIGRLEGTQKQMLEEMRAGFRRINGNIEEHTKKINSLENENAYRRGLSAAISFAISSAVSFFSFLFRDK